MEKFEFADFKISSNDANEIKPSHQIVNACGDNGLRSSTEGMWSIKPSTSKES